jgi:hypothetical protein
VALPHFNASGAAFAGPPLPNYFDTETVMATQSQTPGGNGDPSSQSDTDDEDTFKTDISETDDEGTTVREAEVRKDDLSETQPPESDEKQ